MRAALLCLGLVACAPAPTTTKWEWSLPKGFPEPAVPADNPMTVECVELGRALFFDTRLSQNETQSCASCHEPARAFTDARVHAVGSTGVSHRRNSQGLANVAWASSLTWANPLLGTLEAQALVPLFGETPVELGWAGREDELLSRLEAHREAFEKTYPAHGVSLFALTRALSCFERTLISGNAPYDRGELGDDAKAGLELFNSERLECYHCHTGFTFSDSVSHAQSGPPQRPFHNTGLYDVDGQGSYPATDTGLFEESGRAGDMGRFRAPTLRNLAYTAPYMHDGSIATLEDVIDAYAAGGSAKAVSGHASPLQSDLVRGFELTADERRQLLAFLHSLDDEWFVVKSWAP
ncbi:MAG: di-heme enzyme [Archangium gephyra]|uniref:Di-heme enzyme n=1 Tax=Archangium gephyra TaxID=48 RepID=A0A2W5TVQ2_9BACT|nr:MAG: di-heme enzyme [Archangium gephyra]